jgi:hypothetical protein
MKLSKFIAPVFAVALSFVFTAHVSASVPTYQVGIVQGVVSAVDNTPAVGANITAVCNTVTLNTTTNSAGFYLMQYGNGVCNAGDSIPVTATKGSESGSQNGFMTNFGTIGFIKLDVGTVNVPMVPEFGLITGAIALAASFGSFALFKRKV